MARICGAASENREPFLGNRGRHNKMLGITIARAAQMRPAGNAPFQTFLPGTALLQRGGVVRVGDR